MKYNENVEKYIKDNLEETYALYETIVRIPAPSYHEEKKAEFCKKWLEEQGAEGVYIDEALNVIYPVNCENCDEIIVFAAHTDVVFPDLEPVEFKRDDKYFYAPGIGDDTSGLVAIFMTLKYILSHGLKARTGLLFVANSCEEGLGNLKGSKQLLKDYAGRIKAFYSFDAKYTGIYTRCVGSYRYEIECTTEGGHSFSAFGKSNAIAELSKLIYELYSIDVPANGESKTTYNVGMIEGGTSVNTIAQTAKMLYEYRSDDVSCLNKMTELFEEKLAKVRASASDDVDFKVTTIGIRPCQSDNIDKAYHEEMIQNVISICEKHSGVPCERHSGSTDCNAFMSVGVPGVALGCSLGGGAHTREEYLQIDSIEIGLRIAAELILQNFQ